LHKIDVIDDVINLNLFLKIPQISEDKVFKLFNYTISNYFYGSMQNVQ